MVAVVLNVAVVIDVATEAFDGGTQSGYSTATFVNHVGLLLRSVSLVAVLTLKNGDAFTSDTERLVEAGYLRFLAFERDILAIQDQSERFHGVLCCGRNDRVAIGTREVHRDSSSEQATDEW